MPVITVLNNSFESQVVSDGSYVCGVDDWILAGGSYGGGGAKGGRVVGGRVVGTLTTEFINELENQCRFQHVECPVGGVLLFDGWVPHRDSVNNTMESRDAVFFVYTTKLDCGGDQHAKYYKRIQLLTARCI